MTAELRPWIGPHGQVMERLELHLTYHCSDRCVFCSEDHRMRRFNRFDVTWGRVATVLRKHAERGVTAVHFTGGEPTLHPQFVEVLQLAKKLGMRTSIGTIGTMLAHRDFAEKAVPWLDEALFSVHGPNAEVNNALTGRSRSFQRTTAAIRNALAINPDFNLFINTVITTKNIHHLPDTVAMVDEMGAKLVVVSNLTPEGAGFDNYAELAVPLATLREVLPQVPARAKRAVVRFFGVPMCLLGDHWASSNDLHWDPRVTAEWAAKPGRIVFDDIYSWTPDRKRLHVDACGTCSRRSICMGVNDRYAELFSTEELEPFAEGAA